ncbi:MAG TPA: class I SAM-dependent methyltransferase [Acidimicrobiia bacterium]|nr:class I SAM-dependent methyltransferase [Acidimicrobiia bacterium]
MSAESDPIFTRIARRYDLINRILSFGQDQNWRRRAVRFLPEGIALDLGSGTGAAAPIFGDRRVLALDPVHEMLSLAPISERVVAVGESLPFADESIDAVFSAYVFRNLTSVQDTLGEIARVLRPGGRVAIVDLGRPRGRLAAMLHRLGSAVFLPLAGLLVRAPADYWYLHRSLDKLGPPELLYVAPGMTVVESWRMGPLGFVHGVVLEKS